MRAGTGSAASHIIRSAMVFCCVVGPAIGAEPAAAGPTKQGTMTDKSGNRWTLTPSGNLSGSSLPVRRGFVTSLYVDDRSHSYSAAPLKESSRGDKKPRPKPIEAPPELASDARFNFQAPDQTDIQWTHFVRFDGERGGMRFIEVFSNAGSEPHAIRVRCDTDVSVPNSDSFQGATTERGEIISGDNPMIPSDANALMLHFTSDFSAALPFYLFGSSNSPWATSRTLSGYRLALEYGGTLEPGKRVVLVHWIGGRGAKETGRPEKAMERFISDGRLIAPGVPAEWQADVINFSREAFEPASTVASGPGEKLVMLDQLCKRLGITRSEKDFLVLDRDSRVEGETKIAKITLNRDGKPLDIPLPKVAAISGGGGTGREHRVFFRDGSVLAGRISLADGRFVSTGAGDVALNADSLDHLILHTATEIDGQAGGAAGVVKTHRGEILRLASLPSRPLPGRTSTGVFEIPWADITVIRERYSPDPCFVVMLKDGSRVICLPEFRDTAFRLDGGEEWRAETGLSALTASAEGLESLLLPEKETEEKPKGGWCEMARGSIWAGRAAEGELQVESAAGITKFDSTALKSIRRPADALPAGTGSVFDVELKNGLKVRGRFVQPALQWQRGAQVLELPWSQIQEVATEVEK